MQWVAVRYHDRPLGTFWCIDDAEIALLAARFMWGSAVLYVQSKCSWDVAQEEKRIPPHRIIPEDDSDKDCA